MKVVINTCFGGFSLSTKAIELYYKYKDGRDAYHFSYYSVDNKVIYTPKRENEIEFMIVSFDVPNPSDFDEGDLWKHHLLSNTIDDENRNDPALVRVVEELGDKANGVHAELEVIEIPDGVDFEIQEYDGIESIHEKHRSWR